MDTSQFLQQDYCKNMDKVWVIIYNQDCLNDLPAGIYSQFAGRLNKFEFKITPTVCITRNMSYIVG